MLSDTVSAGYCYGGDDDYNTDYLGYASSGSACPAGEYNPGCGWGCVEAFAGKFLIL